MLYRCCVLYNFRPHTKDDLRAYLVLLQVIYFPIIYIIFFSLRIFLYYIDIHVVHEREKCTPLPSYISRTVNVGAELNVYGKLS